VFLVEKVQLGLNSPDPLVREAFLMAHDYIDYVTTGGADALRHAGDELLIRFPIFFRETTACPMLVSILDEHFFPPVPGGQRRDLAWSAVLSVYVLAGQMALHCHERGMEAVLTQLKECVGGYVERVICPEIRDKGGWSGFVSRFGVKQDLEGHVKRVCCWSLLALASSILIYCLWKRVA
uniref:Bcl-2 Bcl-2 homology region 1-3 domain-containing protein n=1 Tax=Sphaeramia orbicularis TaxID=375764 RepID=A0A673BPY4_9TELE